jgi:hypothetical protein
MTYTRIVILFIWLRKQTNVLVLLEDVLLILHLRKYLYYTKSIVRPILEYGSTVWSPYLIKDIEALDKVQRRCTRISNQPFHIEQLELRRRSQDMCEVYKYLHHRYKTNTDKLFKLNTSITRGHSFKLAIKHFARTDIRKTFFSNRVVNCWNDLPSAVVSAPTLDSFKRGLMSLPDW